MDNFGAITVPAQNFAIASRQFLWTPRRERGALALPTELDRLESAVVRTWVRWWDLFQAPDVWTDARMRSAMCAARLEYQDAMFELADACAALSCHELQ